jgi:DNA-binding NarL/FixJ family response regulator
MISHFGGGAASPRYLPATASSHGAIVLIAKHNALTQGLVRALQLHMPGCEITLSEEVPDTLRADEGVDLALICVADHAGLAGQVELTRRRYPRAAVGLVVDDGQPLEPCDELFNQQQVLGVLPLSLGLDIWLAAASLLASGGEYYPPALSRRRYAAPPPGIEEPPVPDTVVGSDASTGVAPLTSRELEVLELVALGHQNKSIADRMALSEHTVKVHVHNIIGKLRVSNRTQAAAAFRSVLTRAGKPAAPAAVWRGA